MRTIQVGVLICLCDMQFVLYVHGKRLRLRQIWGNEHNYTSPYHLMRQMRVSVFNFFGVAKLGIIAVTGLENRNIL